MKKTTKKVGEETARRNEQLRQEVDRLREENKILTVDNKAAGRVLDAAREEIETLLKAQDLLADMVVRRLADLQEAEARVVNAAAVAQDMSLAIGSLGHPVMNAIGQALVDAGKRSKGGA